MKLLLVEENLKSEISDLRFCQFGVSSITDHQRLSRNDFEIRKRDSMILFASIGYSDRSATIGSSLEAFLAGR